MKKLKPAKKSLDDLNAETAAEQIVAAVDFGVAVPILYNAIRVVMGRDLRAIETLA